jgi:lysozyme family protein
MFDHALTVILKAEGGYVNHPLDRGRATNYGVTQSTYDSYRKKVGQSPQSVRAITPDELKAIYEVEYWIASGANQIADFNEEVALLHFDCAVNCGVGSAIKMLQKLVDVKVDGKFGPVTRQRVMYESNHNLYTRYMAARLKYYIAITRRDKTQMFFLAGWVKRMADLLERAEIQ